MSSRSLMKHRANVRRNTPVNSEGVIISAFSIVTANLPLLVQEGSGTVRRDGSGAGLEYDATAFIPPDADVRPDNLHDQRDQLTLTHPPALAGRTYLVKLVVDESGMGDHKTAYLERVRKG